MIGPGVACGHRLPIVAGSPPSGKSQATSDHVVSAVRTLVRVPVAILLVTGVVIRPSTGRLSPVVPARALFGLRLEQLNHFLSSRIGRANYSILTLFAIFVNKVLLES